MRSLLLLILLLLPVVAPGAEQSGSETINASGCVCDAEADCCVLCPGDTVEVTVEIKPEEGSSGDHDREFTVRLTGPGSFSDQAGDRERKQVGCPSEQTYQVTATADAKPGDEIGIEVEGVRCETLKVVAGIFVINVRQPTPGTAAAFAVRSIDPLEVDVGHTWFMIRSCDPQNIPGRLRRFVNTPMGFSPRARNPRPTPQQPQVPGRLYVPDPSTDPSLSHCFGLDAEGVQRALEFVKDIHDQRPAYDLNGFNCTTCAVQAGTAGGAPVPSGTGAWPGGGGSNPGQLGEDLRSLDCE